MTEVLEQVVEQPIAVVLEEKIYVYQPVDENSRPIGGKQVIKYHTQEELVSKLQEQNVLLIRKLRSETRKNRLGIIDAEQIPDEAPRLSDPIEFKPRVLSDDERFELSRKLLDPTTALEATSTLIEAGFGMSLEKVGNSIAELQRDSAWLRAKIESDAFMASTPDYYKCEENKDAIVNWMIRYDLAPVRENFKKAFETLKVAGVLVMEGEPTPVVVEPVVEIPPVVAPVRVPEVSVPVISRIPSGLTRDDASDTGVSPQTDSSIIYEFESGGKKVVLKGRAALQAMPADQYAKLIRNPEMLKEIQKLDSEAVKSKRV